jgi:hypothetical protein
MGVIRLAAGCTLASLAFAGSAAASEHLMTVSEIAFKAGDVSNAQYVELVDPFAEPFSSPTYKLVHYDSAGAEVAALTLPHPFGITPMLIANDAAAALPGFPARDAALTFILPTAAGQLCFNNGTIDIQCMVWGSITPAGMRSPESGSSVTTQSGVLDATSMQRRPSNGAIVFGTANPKAENIDTPVATTGAADEITTSSAKLNGTVNPSQLATTYSFAFGRTAAYGQTTTTGNAPAGGSPLAFSGTITGLEPGTTYHYGLNASNRLGDVSGADRTFTTAAVPGGPSGPSGPGAGGPTGPGGATGPTGAVKKPDRTKPRVTPTVPSRLSLASLIRNGLRGFVRVNEAARVTLELRRGSRIVLGSARLTYTKAARRRFTLRLRLSGKTLLKASRSKVITATFRIRATDRSGNLRIVNRTIRLTK